MKALVAHELHVLRRAIQHGLGILHFESEGVSDSNAMLVELGKIKPALLIVDIDLPPFGAAQAIRSARGFDNGNEKIIVVQKDSDLGLAASLRKAGAHEVILGGYDAHKLETKLRALGLVPL